MYYTNLYVLHYMYYTELYVFHCIKCTTLRYMYIELYVLHWIVIQCSTYTTLK